MNPPVDAPRSWARRPSTATANRVSAASSFSPPRPTKRGAGPEHPDRLAGRHEPGGLVGGRSADGDAPGRDVGLGLLAAGRQAPPHQLGVEAAARQRSGLLRGGAFLAGALLGRRLLRVAVFLAAAFLAAVFLAAAFLAGAFLAGAFFLAAALAGAVAVPITEAIRSSMRSRSAWRGDARGW